MIPMNRQHKCNSKKYGVVVAAIMENTSENEAQITDISVTEKDPLSVKADINQNQVETKKVDTFRIPASKRPKKA